MNILVTGGAGYIGSICVKTLLDSKHNVVVVDNCVNGDEDYVDSRAELHILDLCDKKGLDDIFDSQTVDAVIHFAAYKSVEESMTNTSKYSDNITGTISLLDCMVAHDVKKIVFSSSAAVYGMPSVTRVTEETPTVPINYYGETKLIGEKLISWYANVHGIVGVALRYFNVAGDVLGYIESHAENVFPILMQTVVGTRDSFTINGTDYDTRDGTCVRDYIHVQDLVDAHIKALDCSESVTLNLGTGRGTTVAELVSLTKEVTGVDFNVLEGTKRAGDPAALVASFAQAKRVLGWEPHYTVRDMVESIYRTYKKEADE